ncbi:hypothetical protein H1R20_g2013, partial [Candolleomyces eurysporus]
MFTTRFLHVLLLSSLAVAWVELDPSLIPPVPELLEVYSLGDPSFLPHEWLEGIVGNVAHGVKFTKRDDDSSKVYAYNGEELVGFVDKNTGETRVYPDYANIPAAKNPIDIKHALKIFEHGKEGFPADDTHLELIKGASLVGSTLKDTPDHGNYSRRWNDEEPESTFLTHGILQRRIEAANGQKFLFCGPGSQANFGVGPDNKIFSLSYRWKPAKKSGKKVKAKPAEKVAQAIKKAMEGKRRVKVKRVDTCYYDSGVQFVQPAYRVLAESIPEDDGNNATGRNQILRFFPIGEELVENVFPEGPSSEEEPPVEPKDNKHTQAVRSVKPNYFEARASLYERVIKPTVTVGRYVTRNDSDQAAFLENANGFWGNLAASTSLVNFVNSQYYWAYPWLYGSSALSFVNSVNVALTESHGTNHLFSTWKNSGSFETVDIPSTLPSDGYGPGPSDLGRLAYWLINACEVIPTRIDFPSDPAPIRRAFDPWWPVFRGGLHAVLGWRTSPFFSDNVAVNTATAMAQGRPVASAWLDEAHNDPVYANRPTYIGHVTGVEQPNGRPTVIYPCGRGSDKVWQVENLGRPTCLEMRYYNND